MQPAVVLAMLAGCYSPTFGGAGGDGAPAIPDGRADADAAAAADGAPPIDGAADAATAIDGAPDGMNQPPDGLPIDAAPGCGPDDTPCAMGDVIGRCYGGACCTGCWNGVACRAGTSEIECGRDGLACTQCLGTCGCDALVCGAQGDRYDSYLCSMGACVPAFFACCGPRDGAFCDPGLLECTAFGCSL
jgi:hypothetical protein